MRKYGSKKSSRPYERIHKVHGPHKCGECCSYNEIPTKSRRSNEKRKEKQILKEYDII